MIKHSALLVQLRFMADRKRNIQAANGELATDENRWFRSFPGYPLHSHRRGQVFKSPIAHQSFQTLSTKLSAWAQCALGQVNHIVLTNEGKQ